MRWDVVVRMLPRPCGALLEIGCGQGAFGARLAAVADDYLGVEPDVAAFEVAAPRISGRGTVLNTTVEALPADRTFDVVCAFEVLEHLADDRGALASWVTRLRPGGRLLLSTPAWSGRMGAHDEAVGHFRRYDPPQLVRLLLDAGLERPEVRLFGGPVGYALEHGRNLAARRRPAGGSMADRTAGSGRYLQPRRGAGRALAAVATPLALASARLFPDRGPGLVAAARRPPDRP